MGYDPAKAVEKIKEAILKGNLVEIHFNGSIIYKNFVGTDKFFEYIEDAKNKIRATKSPSVRK